MNEKKDFWVYLLNEHLEIKADKYEEKDDKYIFYKGENAVAFFRAEFVIGIAEHISSL